MTKFLNISTDTTLGGNSPSDEVVSSQKAISTALATKQDTLVSGTNIKTVNSNSLLGSGDISISAQATWGNITGTLSDQTDLKNALDAKANDNAVVHLANDETITGAKTFTSGGSNVIITRGSATFTEIKTELGNGTRSGGFRNIAQNGNTTLMYVASGSTYKGGVAIVDDGVNVYGTAPKAPTTNLTTDDKIATTGWVNDATTATNVVHRDSNENITGLKTVLRDDSLLMYAKSSVIDNTVTPSSNQHLYCDFVDKNGVRLGVIGGTKRANGQYGVYMQAGNVGALFVLTDGSNTYVSAPTPNANANNTQLATTAWCMGHGILIASQTPSSSNNYTWYRKYSDGWVEQGGIATIPSRTNIGSSSLNKTFPVAMTDTNYTCQISFQSGGTYYANCTLTFLNKTTTGADLAFYFNGSGTTAAFVVGWQVSGVAA